MPDVALLSIKNIHKSFPGVKALDGVNVEVQAGSIMALVGENGAGKSTLIKILSGALAPDTGDILIDGKPIKIFNPVHAQALGIAVIHQELNLALHLSVAENIFAGREFVNKWGLIDFPAMRENATKWLQALHIQMDPDIEVQKLSIAHKQIVEIAKALSFDARIIVMDEPTSSLPTTSNNPELLNEVEILLDIITKLRNQGKAIIYVSHRMNEIFKISDTISVFRDGKSVGTCKTADTNQDKIVSLMVGRKLQDLYGYVTPRIKGKAMLEVRGLSKKNALHNISFFVASKEILGVAGLIGAGRSEMLRCVFGADPKDEGEIYVDGKRVAIHNPHDAIQFGIGFIPEDRKLSALFLDMAIKTNITAASIKTVSRANFIQGKKENKVAENYVSSLRIRTSSIEKIVGSLSGGNQQKVVIAKWMLVAPKILIMDEPTRGIDVGAKIEIYNLMREMAAQGMAIIMISSELPEILGMSDRIIVLREGRITATFSRNDATEEKIMASATGLVLHKR